MKIKTYHVKDLDFRPPEPGYVSDPDGNVKYFCRQPARSAKQGLTVENSYFKSFWSGKVTNVGGNEKILSYFVNRPRVVKFGAVREAIEHKEISVVRLSNRLAVGRDTRKRSSPIFAEWCGRPLGTVKEDTVLFDDKLDQQMPWIKKELDEVNLRIG